MGDRKPPLRSLSLPDPLSSKTLALTAARMHFVYSRETDNADRETHEGDRLTVKVDRLTVELISSASELRGQFWDLITGSLVTSEAKSQPPTLGKIAESLGVTETLGESITHLNDFKRNVSQSMTSLIKDFNDLIRGADSVHEYAFVCSLGDKFDEAAQRYFQMRMELVNLDNNPIIRPDNHWPERRQNSLN
ncbi:hypothetical protein TREMEDRAFT_59925 [Tremella mesenterica DSM 1558]|uniref:uncharacterized protein n=1 Tax=Tremella mesenterica (strain ATCC 24925 / CBS 8224 / DSM 1558 / NBRC 9311 / NRRL Y-6157 / RJB 2259-6 / UBC 559-6) TaxID=578456 RepID=UPI0003F49E3E|nr:uncharacterized protein TREMEDRAFT_59925 [Tremella mesenterica DSM 1558]EIW70987.1 hypothetical protein TREMEDRAFT_59925 [Tremella mesenterica DSM 1558]